MSSIANQAAALSPEARRALTLTGRNKVLAAFSPAKVITELVNAGMVGPRQGLTIRGECVAQHLQDVALDDAFGSETRG